MARRRRRRSSGAYHSHATYPYSHPRSTVHHKAGSYRRGRRRALPRRNPRTGRFVRGR